MFIILISYIKNQKSAVAFSVSQAENTNTYNTHSTRTHTAEPAPYAQKRHAPGFLGRPLVRLALR